jgi:hypothetical protein
VAALFFLVEVPDGAFPLEKYCRRNAELFAQFLDMGLIESAFLG